MAEINLEHVVTRNMQMILTRGDQTLFKGKLTEFILWLCNYIHTTEAQTDREDHAARAIFHLYMSSTHDVELADKYLHTWAQHLGITFSMSFRADGLTEKTRDDYMSMRAFYEQQRLMFTQDQVSMMRKELNIANLEEE